MHFRVNFSLTGTRDALEQKGLILFRFQRGVDLIERRLLMGIQAVRRTLRRRGVGHRLQRQTNQIQTG